MLEIVTAICGLILPRLILSNFGTTYNGITQSISQFISCVALLKTGIGSVTRAALYKPLAANDSNGISEVVNATESFMKKIAFGFLGGVILFAIVYPILIDNAIEAVSKQETRKNIEIILGKHGERNLFRIINPHEFISSKQINQFFEKGYSTKEKKSKGIGLYKLKQILEKKGDIIFFYYDISLKSVIAEIQHT